MPVRIVVSSSRQVAEIRARLKNPEPALRAVGALMVAASQLAFRQQRLGDIKWPERYPNQQEPFINIAGMLADLNQGSAIKERRFQRRPALIDRGQLRDSVTFAASSTSVRVGSSKDYAAIHQHGLVSTLKVSPSVKKGVVKFLRSARGKPYREKLTFLLAPNLTQYDVEVVRRPFLGLTPDAEEEAREAVEAFVAGEFAE